ncbi:arylsulfatase [Limnohabitans sp. B9-3]|uniref:arylsulfatase n=1 Tax=Limnohabitans sp. B9-3 TaxID=1100707 RepID=UPI000C1F4417|nr:arylsulfatase [Limnohabitans sp. B9-3]PIT78800.1 arylsulfatase [Limnohabitans sp. B9-3]
MTSKPNVLLILADDMGFSDIGCYGSEIDTPHIDRLAAAGVRFSQFYNTARCSPSRASMLTGLHPHQTGIGILTKDDRPHGYPGSLNDRCVTVAEILSAAGYATSLVGKWHLASNIRQPNDAWPTRRGFDHFYGTLAGSCSYFQPASLTRGERNVEAEATEKSDYYYTDAISQEACTFVREQSHAQKPFFMYVAYTAPHWPLQANEEDIAKYRGRYDEGWDVLRERRMQRLRESGLLADAVQDCERDPEEPAWEQAEHKAWEARRMEVYAAQVHRMDQGIGELLATLKQTGQLENTLIFFLSDNGACAEVLPLDGSAEAFKKRRPDLDRLKPRHGGDLQVGNEPSIVPGSEDTYASYGRAWANLSNTPFRLYKRWTHEGGIATPLIVHWPAGGLNNGAIVRAPFQLTDILPTILEATQVLLPEHGNNRDIPKGEGCSFLPVLRGGQPTDHTLYWEHTGNAAIRRGRWKLVREYPKPWELYDMDTDRAEKTDLALSNREVVRELVAQWEAWADRVGVVPWDHVLAGYRAEGKSEADAAG